MFPLLENKTVLLTGGTGFFGKSILAMLERGLLPQTRFLILSRKPEQFLAAHPRWAKLTGVNFFAGDVRDFTQPDRRIDLILHAATPAVTTLAPGEMRSIILEGTGHVLEVAARAGVSRLLFTSSGAVYGPQPPELERIGEDFPCRPVTEYGIAKLEAEKMCLDSGIDCGIARCFAFTGAHLNREIHFAVGNFLRDALAGRPIVINGDGTAVRSYLYADDLVRWLFTIFERGAVGRCYNVGSDRAVSIAELARLVRDVLHSSSAVEIRGIPDPAAAAHRYVPDVSRCRSELGLEVYTPLEEALRLSAAD